MTTTDQPSPIQPTLNGREFVVAVCGGIAAYKVANVVSGLVQRGGGVTVAMTESATRFVGPLTFRALSGREVLANLWQSPDATDPQHIGLTRRSDLLVIAPATANMIGKIANGLADDLISSMVMASSCPILLAPAMNDQMWNHPAVQNNLKKIQEFGYQLVGPMEGWLACRTVGAGRMAEPGDIIATIERLTIKKKKS